MYFDDEEDQSETAIEWRKYEDWNTFIDLREKELRNSGLLVVCTVTASKKDHLDQPFIKSTNFLIEALIKILEDEGLSNYRQDFLIPAAFLNQGLITYPFSYDRPLKLMSYETKRVSWPYYNYKVDSNEDAENLSKIFTNFYEALSGNIYRSGFQKHISDINKVEQLYKSLYEMYNSKNKSNLDTLTSMHSFNYFYICSVKVR